MTRREESRLLWWSLLRGMILLALLTLMVLVGIRTAL